MNNLEVRRIGEEIWRGRIKTNIHKIYESKVEVFKSWLNSNYPRYNKNGEIRQPLPAEIITDFIAHIFMKFDENGQHMVPPIFNSFSHVNAYQSQQWGKSGTWAKVVPFLLRNYEFQIIKN